MPGTSTGDNEYPYVALISDGDRVSDVVVEAVAELAGRKMMAPETVGNGETDLLYNNVDPDALDRIFRGSDENVRVRFEYAGYEVTVIGGARVLLRPRE